MKMLNAEEAQAFESLIELLASPPENREYALIRAELDEKEVAVVAGLIPIGDGTEDTLIVPMAILVNPDLFSRLNQP